VKTNRDINKTYLMISMISSAFPTRVPIIPETIL